MKWASYNPIILWCAIIFPSYSHLLRATTVDVSYSFQELQMAKAVKAGYNCGQVFLVHNIRLKCLKMWCGTKPFLDGCHVSGKEGTPIYNTYIYICVCVRVYMRYIQPLQKNILKNGKGTKSCGVKHHFEGYLEGLAMHIQHTYNQICIYIYTPTFA